MNSKEKDLLELVNIFMLVVEANKGVPAGEDNRLIDAEGLALKFYSHSISTIYLRRGINIPDLMIPIVNFPDPPSVNVLVRAAFETFLVFYYIFIDSQNVNEIDLKYKSWELSGLYQRQKFPASTEENINKLANEKILINDLEEEIKSNSVFQLLSLKQKNNYFTKLKRSGWRSKGWAEIALSAGFSELNSQLIYSYLCDHAHSGNISATQVSQSTDFKVRNELIKAAIGHLNICVANMIKYYCNYFPKSGEFYINNYEEPNIVSMWIEIGAEA